MHCPHQRRNNWKQQQNKSSSLPSQCSLTVSGTLLDLSGVMLLFHHVPPARVQPTEIPFPNHQSQKMLQPSPLSFSSLSPCPSFLSHIFSHDRCPPSPPSCTLQPFTHRTLAIKSKYLTPFLFFIFPWGLFVSFLSECQASAWVSKQTSSSRNDVSENCHRLGMSCQSLCWANDYCWMLWELKVSNSGHFFFFFCSCYGLTHACAVGSLMSRFLILCPLVKTPVALWFVRLISLTCNRWRTKLITTKACEIPRTWL